MSYIPQREGCILGRRNFRKQRWGKEEENIKHVYLKRQKHQSG